MDDLIIFFLIDQLMSGKITDEILRKILAFHVISKTPLICFVNAIQLTKYPIYISQNNYTSKTA